MFLVLCCAPSALSVKCENVKIMTYFSIEIRFFDTEKGFWSYCERSQKCIFMPLSWFLRLCYTTIQPILWQNIISREELGVSEVGWKCPFSCVKCDSEHIKFFRLFFTPSPIERTETVSTCRFYQWPSFFQSWNLLFFNVLDSGFFNETTGIPGLNQQGSKRMNQIFCLSDWKFKDGSMLIVERWVNVRLGWGRL